MRPSTLIARPLMRPSLWLLAAAGLATSAAGQTYVWRGGGPSDEWRFRQNWKPEGIPGIAPVGVNASIPEGGSTVLGWSNVVLNSLTVDGSTNKRQPRLSIAGPTFVVNVGSLRDVHMFRATLVANGPVSFDGEVSVLETTFRGSGETALVGGTMNVGRTTWDGSTFRNLASVTQDLGVSLMNGATLFNSGRWEMTGISSNGSIGPHGGGGFVNSGQFVYRSSQGPGFGGSIGSALDNTGTILAEVGTLQCAGGGTHIGGEWITRGAGVLRMHGRPDSRLYIEQSVNVSGEGVMRLGSFVTIRPSASLNVNGLSFIEGDLFVTGLGRLHNQGIMTWVTGKIITFDQGKLDIAPGSTLLHRQGELQGLLSLSGMGRQEGPLTIHDGAVLEITRSGEWQSITGDIGRAQLPTTGRIECTGMLRKPGDTEVGVSTISVPLMLLNGGTLRVEASRINITGGGGAEGDPTNHVYTSITGEVRFSDTPFLTGQSGFSTFSLEGEGIVRIATRLAGPNLLNFLGLGGVGMAILENGEIGGRLDNVGFLDLRGGTVNTLANHSTVLISGGQVTLSGLFHSESGTVRQTGGPLQLTGNGQVENVLAATWELIGTVAILNNGTGEFFNSGTLVKTGAGTAQVHGRFNVIFTGTVDVQQGTLILFGPLIGLGGERLDKGNWIVHPGARLVTPGVTISAIGAQAGVKISGPFEDRWASLDDLQENGGTFTVSGRDQATTLEGGLENTGTLVSEDGGELHAPESILNDIEGTVEQEETGAEGPVGGFFCPSLVNEGTIRPGGDMAAGPFRLVGDLEMMPTGRIEVELGGPEPYFHYDRADVSGAATLAGSLDVRLLGQYAPEENDTFRVLQAGSVSGAFDTVIAPIGRGLIAVALYDATGVTLRIERGCYPDCDPSSGPGTLDIFDFLCFQNLFDAADPYACDCDLSGGPGVCDVFDFLCFLNEFGAGCP